MVRAHEKRTDVLASGQSGGSTGTGLHYGQVDGTPSEVMFACSCCCCQGHLVTLSAKRLECVAPLWQPTHTQTHTHRLR